MICAKKKKKKKERKEIGGVELQSTHRRGWSMITSADSKRDRSLRLFIYKYRSVLEKRAP